MQSTVIFPFDNMKLNKDFFTTPPKIQEEDTVFSEEEQNSIIALAEADAQRTRKAEPLGILILFHLALRDGELCSLKWGDILKKGKKSRIHIQRGLTGNIDEEVNKIRGYRTVDHCKTPAGDRILPLNQTAKDALREINSTLLMEYLSQMMILFLSELLKESKNYAIHEFLIQDYASIASKQECLL